MDNGSSCNYGSSMLVEKLTLTTKPHLKPYKLEWIKDNGRIIVKDQVTIPISISNYDENCCATLFLLKLGISYLVGHDNMTINLYDGYNNKINLFHKGKITILIPLTPHQVREKEIKKRKRKE